MQLHDLDTYAFAIDWSVWIAAIVALSVFVLVTRLMLDVLPTLHLNLEFRPLLSRPKSWPKSWRPKSWRPKSWRPKSWRRVRAQPLAVVDRPTEADAEWQAMTGILETRADRLHALSATQERAERCIEAAEYALERLLADCAAVQLTPDEGTRPLRRRIAHAEAPAVLPVASPEPLAA